MGACFSEDSRGIWSADAPAARTLNDEMDARMFGMMEEEAGNGMGDEILLRLVAGSDDS
jgi:hypothetical protein